MKSATQCLQPSDIDALLAGTGQASQIELWEEHFSFCESCRMAMASQVGDPKWWREAEQSLLQPVGDSLQVSQIHLGEPAQRELSDEPESLEELLKLLGPTDDPKFMGRIGTYEVLGVLGRGGMGIVFKAFDAPLNRFVAIKTLLPHLAASGAARKRFAREAQAVAAVVDDHVMAIHCVDEWQGVPYLVMTYSRGITLQKRLSDNGPLEVREILRIGMQAAKGLAAAHAQGIVHRDIKPANIFLDQNVERVQLMDFGLARAVDDASLTRTGVLAGTPQYMSPEQARAETVDHRSDLFSLGSVMYAMCTGHAPFRAESSYSVLRLITDKEPRPIREVNPDVPDWLCSIIAKLMAKQAGDRFSSANQVAELFQVCLAHLQSPTTTAMPAEFANVKPGRSSSKFHQLLMGVFAMCCLSFLAILLVMQNVEPPAQTGPSKPEKNSQPSQSGKPLQVSASDSGQSSEVHQSIADDSVLMISVDSVLPASDQGHPFIVKNSSIVLPSLDKPILVSGRSMSEIESAISEAYLKQLKVTTKTRIHEVRTTSPATVITVNQKSLSGIWKAKQIISAGQVVPPDKASGEFVFRRNQMIWKFTGKIKRDDVIFDVELDVTKSPIWITLRSQDPKRPQPVLGLIDFTGHELRIFTKRDAKGNPSTERPTAIGTGNEPGTDLMILELKSFSVDEMKTYSIDEYVSNVVAQWKKSSNDGVPSEEAINAKVTEVGNKLAEDIDRRFGPCNLIEFDATSKRLIIDHTPQAHRKIEAFLKESIATSFALLTLSEQPEPEANAQVRAQASSTEVTLGQGPDIAELLETAAKHEEWFSKMRSVHFRAKGRNVQSEKALEVERAKLIARGADAVVPIKSPSLLPSFEFSDEIAWDGKRVANIRKYSLGLDNSHWVWDGTQSTTVQDGTNAAYILDNEDPFGMEAPLSGVCYWPFDPRFALRTKPNDNLKGFAADDFTLHIPDLFHGVRCYRLVSIDKQIALFIAVDSGLMIGKREGILTEPIVPILKSLGHDVKNTEEARKLLSELEPARLMEVRKAGEQIAKKIAADTLLNGPTVLEAWVSGFQPTPLGVFPMKHYRRVSGVDADVPYERYRSELEVVELKTNEPIDSTLFEVEFRDGVTVVDNRFETPITYSYDSKMTSEDLKALVRKSLESSNELDALVGKPLPALTNLSWINSESRDIASFKGRPLIVECWAVGCGPCRSHFATLNSLNEAGKIQVIGFHTATKDVESITRFAQDLKLGYPIVVDTGDDSKNAFGPLPVTRMPYTILVDASGTIVAHGDLETLLPKAFEMVASNKPAEAQRQLSADDGSRESK